MFIFARNSIELMSKMPESKDYRLTSAVSHAFDTNYKTRKRNHDVVSATFYLAHSHMKEFSY